MVARAALEDIATEQREQKALLEKEKGKRKALVTQLSSKLGEQRRQAGSLARDEERLSSLVDRLAVLIAQQRKADEEEAKRRAKARAEAAAAREKQLAEKSRKDEKAKPDAAPKSEPPPKAAPRKPEPELAELPPPPDGNAFAALRGKGKDASTATALMSSIRNNGANESNIRRLRNELSRLRMHSALSALDDIDPKKA